MPNWEDMARQMTVPFGGVRALNPQPVQQRPDMNALAQGLNQMLFGGTMLPAPGADPRYQPPPASETWKRALSMGVDFMPGPGDVKALQEAATGQNLITGDKLGGWERALSGAGALPFIPNVAGLMAGKGALKAPLGKVANVSKYFDEATTGTSYWDGLLKNGEASIVKMSPDEYLAKVAEQQGVSIDRTLQAVPENLINEYAGRMTKGEKAPLPLIDYVESTQEGRARALAAKKLGEKEIPVLVRQITKQPKSGLSLAEDLFKKGADEDAIWNQTGWRRDPKGNWAFEIDDSKMQVHIPYKDVMPHGGLPGKNEYKLPEVIKYPELFENYPQFKDTKIFVYDGGKSSDKGNFSSANNIISVNYTHPDLDLKRTIIHEIQHAIQEIEGWPRGSSVDYWKNMKPTAETLAESQSNLKHWNKKLDDAYKTKDAEEIDFYKKLVSDEEKQIQKIQKYMTLDEWQLYHNQYGEFQARDAASRADWDAEARKLVRPYSSEMEPKEGWIYRGGEGKAESAISYRDITPADAIKLKPGDKISVVGKEYEIIAKPKRVGGRPLMIAARPIEGGNARNFQIGAHKIKIAD